jgi:hypothetical protein
MASIAIATAGAVLGGMTAAAAEAAIMTGISVGWSVGMMASRFLLEGPETETSIDGPRLADLTCQSSSYGQSIPIVYGSMRIAGNVIWASGIEEHEHRETHNISGGGKGKGGGSSSTTTTTYTYTVSIAVGLCQGPIVGVRRIWCDGKLMFNKSANASFSDVLNSQEKANSITIYQGTADQEPDPVIEGYEGIGNVSGYRDTAYIVFEDLELKDFGNKIPNIEVEVATSFEEISFTKDIGTSPQHISTWRNHLVLHGASGTFYNANLEPVKNFNVGELVSHLDILSGVFPVNVEGAPNVQVRVDGSSPIALFYNSSGYVGAVDLFTKESKMSTKIGIWIDGVMHPYHTIEKYGNIYNLAPVYMEEGVHSDWRVQDVAIGSINGDAYFVLLYRYGWNGTSSFKIGYIRLSLDWDMNLQYGTQEMKTYPNPSTSYNFAAQSIFIYNNQIYVSQRNHSNIYVFNKNDSQAQSVINMPGSLGGSDMLWYIGVSNGFPEQELIACYADYSSYPSTFNDADIGFFKGISGELKTVTVFNSGEESPASLHSILAHLFSSAGFESTEYDTSELEDIDITGFAVTQPMTLEKAINPLMQAYDFTLTESEGQLKCIPYSKMESDSVSRILNEDELAAHEKGASMPPSIVATKSYQEQIPTKIIVQYQNSDLDYQVAAQSAGRSITTEERTKNIKIPLVLTASQALRIAENMLTKVWLRSTEYEFITSIEHIDLLPGTTIKAAGYKVLITEISVHFPGILQIKGVSADATTFESTAVADPIYIPQQEIPSYIPTSHVSMNLPSLSGANNSGGFYIAPFTLGDSSGWPGAQLYVTNDEGDSWTTIASVFKQPFVGEVTDYSTFENISSIPHTRWDEQTTITVSTLNGKELYSATKENVLNGYNACAIGSETNGWEIISFRNVTDNGNGSYTLSGLLRGLRGTEHHIKSSKNMLVALGFDSLIYVNMPNDKINISRNYRLVTLGMVLTTDFGFHWKSKGLPLKPWSPVHIFAYKMGGDVIISWLRRSRAEESWAAGEVPLLEEQENYEIDIKDSSGNIVRTLTSFTNQVTYTNEDQITDFGTLIGTINVDIYQMSTVIGRGWPGSFSGPVLFFVSLQTDYGEHSNDSCGGSSACYDMYGTLLDMTGASAVDIYFEYALDPENLPHTGDSGYGLDLETESSKTSTFTVTSTGQFRQSWGVLKPVAPDYIHQGTIFFRAVADMNGMIVRGAIKSFYAEWIT